MHAHIQELPRLRRRQPNAGTRVIENSANRFLDEAVPLDGASHEDVVGYRVETIWRKAECVAVLRSGREVRLRDAWQFVGYCGRSRLCSLLFCNSGTHIELRLCKPDPQQVNAIEFGAKRKFVGVDGGVLSISGQRPMLISKIPG